VTRVLSGYANVSDGLRDRVLAAVEQTGYRPDLIAAGLRRGRTNTIGMIVNDILNPVAAMLVDLIESELRVAGYGFILANSNGQAENDIESLNLLSQRRVDGLIASVADDLNPQLMRSLAHLSIPVVLVDRQVPTTTVNNVVSDHYSAGLEIAEHLLERGHREIGLISGSLNAFPSRKRFEGLRDGLAAEGCTIRDDSIASGRGSEEFGRESVARLFDSAHPPTAIVIGNGNTSAFVGILAEMQAREVKIGQDVALVAGEDSPLARFHSPSISVVKRDTNMLGRRATEVLLAHLSHEDARAHSIVLPTRLVVRESSSRDFAS
jgi:LacI family transcriptional regulator